MKTSEFEISLSVQIDDEKTAENSRRFYDDNVTGGYSSVIHSISRASSKEIWLGSKKQLAGLTDLESQGVT